MAPIASSSIASSAASLASACSNVIRAAISIDAVIASGAATAHRTRTPSTRRMSSRHASLARVGHRDEQRPVGEETDREGRAAAGKLLGKLRRHGADRVGLVEVDEGQLVLFRDEPRHLLGRDHAAFHERLAEPLTGDPAVTAVALLGERGFELRAAHQAVTDQQHAEGRPGRRCRSFHFPSDRRISLRT